MSSRALRKAQKEREEALLVKQQQEEEEEGDEEEPRSSNAKVSAFALLGEEEDEAEDDEDRHPLEDESVDENEREQSHNDQVEQKEEKTSKDTKKKKKKKKKKKSKAKAAASDHGKDEVDDIDVALKSLSTSGGGGSSNATAGPVNTALLEACELLYIDTQHLHVGNEMRRLFGRAAFDADREERADQAAARRAGAGGQTAGLAEAVSGRMSSGGAGLSEVIRRRNIFMKGSQDWPRATGSGLSMEAVERRPGGVVEYTFSHNIMYQSAQKSFEACVLSMDPMQLVQAVRYQPYHVATLLQVSEIAKQEKDYATAGELLERALFSFGRAVHSGFAEDIAKGKARLDFRRPENREFYMAAWRYIGNISMRATWRTAYEWAKLLLALNPEEDPYCIRLVIDQFAIRARQASHFTRLYSNAFLQERWQDLPNIHFSQPLALKASADVGKAKEALKFAIQTFPWVAARLFQVVGVDKVPPSVWGKTAPSDHSALHTELYAAQAADLWKTPDALDFLKSMTAEDLRVTSAVPRERDISIDEARHVILTDKPALISLIPRSISSKVDSVSDPLPPEDEIRSYSTSIGRGPEEDLNPPQHLVESNPRGFIEELGLLERFFGLLIPGFSQPDGTEERDALSDDSIDQALERSNASVPELRSRLRRLVSLRQTLAALPGQRIETSSGEYAVMRNGPEGSTDINLNGASSLDAMDQMGELTRSAHEVNDTQDVD